MPRSHPYHRSCCFYCGELFLAGDLSVRKANWSSANSLLRYAPLIKTSGVSCGTSPAIATRSAFTRVGNKGSVRSVENTFINKPIFLA